MSTTTVPVQRVVSGGERRPDSCEVPAKWDRQLAEITDAGCVFTAEILSTGHVNLCLEHPEFGDFMSRLATNGPGEKSPPNVLFGMLRDWDRKRFDRWLEVAQS